MSLLREEFELLVRHPELGEQRSELSPDCRSFVAGRYVIYYRPTSESVELARVLHSAHDLRSLRIER
jgi:toxin ParE1/3/4